MSNNPAPTPATPTQSGSGKTRSPKIPRTIPTWLIQKQVLDHLNSGQHFATDPDGILLYRYDPSQNIYRSDADAWVANEMARFMESRGYSGYWTTNLLRNVRSAMRTNRLHIPRRPPAGKINLLNGVLDLNSLHLSPPSPFDPWVVQIPRVYDPAATCPEWDQWYLPSIFSSDVIPLAYEMFGACMTSDQIAAEAIWLVADGGNGKSTFLDLLSTFLGPDNVSTLSVQDIHKAGFNLYKLEGKLLNIDYDATYAVLRDPAVIKKIISGDPIHVDVKYKDPYTMHPFCKMMFAANNPPVSTDLSNGWERRNLYLNMSKFSSDGRPHLTHDEIWSRLCSPSELSGLLNKAIQGWKRYHTQRGFSKPQEILDYTQEVRDEHHWLPAFIEGYVTWDEGVAKDLGTRGVGMATADLLRKANHFREVYYPKNAPIANSMSIRVALEKVWPGIYLHADNIPWSGKHKSRGLKGLACSYDDGTDGLVN